MTKLLLALFVKDYKNTSKAGVRAAIGQLGGIVGIMCNLLLFTGKLVTGLMTGSLSVIADSINNLSDASSSVVTLLGFKLAQQPADKDHPYGHARYEYLSGLVVAVLILIIGSELLETSVKKIIHPVSVNFSLVAFIIIFCSIALKLWMSYFFSSLGKKINSTALYATAKDCRNDVIVSTVVLLSCLVEYFAKVTVDGYAGLMVALFILFSGIGIVKETVSPLLGQQADRELVERIRKLILCNDKVLGMHDLLVHDYGPGQVFATVHAELDAREDPIICHDIIDHIERDALEKLNVHLVIHYDPVTVNDEEWNSMREYITKIISGIDPSISMHDFRIRGSVLIFDLLVPYCVDIKCGDIHEDIISNLKKDHPNYTAQIRFDTEM